MYLSAQARRERGAGRSSSEAEAVHSPGVRGDQVGEDGLDPQLVESARFRGRHRGAGNEQGVPHEAPAPHGQARPECGLVLDGGLQFAHEDIRPRVDAEQRGNARAHVPRQPVGEPNEKIVEQPAGEITAQQ